MSNPVIVYSAGFFLLALAQKFLIDPLAIFGVRADIILILLVFAARHSGQTAGTLLGFIYGIGMDLLYGSLGLLAFSKTLAGFIAGYFSQSDRRNDTGNFVIALSLATFFHNVSYHLIGNFLVLPFWKMMMLHGIGGTVYTAIFGYISFHWFLRKW